jgi:hypothetical protein
MKSTTWRRAVENDVLPALPGDWLATGYAILQAPIGPLARAIVRTPSSFGSNYYLHVTVQPLYIEMEGWQADLRLQLGHATGEGLWPGFETLQEGTESLRRLANRIQDEALPYLSKHGTPDGFIRLCREQAANHPSFGKVHLLRQLAATEALTSDLAAARRTLTEIDSVAAGVPGAPSWLRDIAAEADSFRATVTTRPDSVPGLLATTEEHMRRRLGLPR